MEVVLLGASLRLFTKAVNCLSKLGTEILLEARPQNGLELRTLNTSCSAAAAVRLRVSCFETYRVTQDVQLGVYSKHLLAVLRTPKMDSITLSLPTQQAPRLTIQLACPKTGLTKTYDVTCIADPQFLCAQVDRRRLSARLVVDAKGLGRLLSNFHSGQSDVTLVSLPERLPVRGQQMAGAASPKRLRLVSHTDAAKSAAAAGAPLTTRLALDVTEEVVQGYTHRGDGMAEASVNLKDLKVMVSFCEALDANVAIFFDSPGAPLVCGPDFRNRITHFFHGTEGNIDFESELVLATMLDHSPAVFEPNEAYLHTALAARRADTTHAAPIAAAVAPESDFTDAPRHQQPSHRTAPPAAALPAPVQPFVSPLAGSAPGSALGGGNGPGPRRPPEPVQMRWGIRVEEEEEPDQPYDAFAFRLSPGA